MATAERRASVVWEGGLADGSGTLNAQDSGVMEEAPVTWASRTEVSEGKTSPEELIAAALATCYAMSLSNLLVQKKDKSPERLEVEAVCAFDDEQLKVTGLDPGRRTHQSFGCERQRRESKRCREQHPAIHQSSRQRPFASSTPQTNPPPG